MFLVNSPIVRGDNLRFREEGVREVISRVLLPWLNSFRFFLGHAALLKKATGHEFKYDARASVSNNVMDRWILARCQSLIKLVRQEMAAYRLYTVIPRLLDLVDELTNWYIRFNRKRLKGEDGKEDTITALNTLFETLFTLCRTMVSATKQGFGVSSAMLTARAAVVVYAVLDGEHLSIPSFFHSRGPHCWGHPIYSFLKLSRGEGGVLR
jgi:isoleucyl-tRNA synthetase